MTHDFASYNTYLNKLNSNEFVVYGAHTQNIPFIVEVMDDIEESISQSAVAQEENDAEIEEEPAEEVSESAQSEELEEITEEEQEESVQEPETEEIVEEEYTKLQDYSLGNVVSLLEKVYASCM